MHALFLGKFLRSRPLPQFLYRLPRHHPLPRRAALSSMPSRSPPSPFRLSPDDQAEFERLQRLRQEQPAFGDPLASPMDISLPAQSPSSPGEQQQPQANGQRQQQQQDGASAAEIDGDKNPRTGEVGGPKQEPLRWGSGGDWSYNGRVTDF